jgi:DNA polymerase-3 subunit chi
MAEALFYHLERRTPEEVLPGLLERTRGRGWRAVLKVGSAERMEALDAHLWTYSEQTFLAHGTAAEGHASRQPIYLTTEEENPNAADVLFLTYGASPSAWDSPALAAYSRVVFLFDGRDVEALNAARLAWRDAKAARHDATYWKQDSSGKWEKQA